RPTGGSTAAATRRWRGCPAGRPITTCAGWPRRPSRRVRPSTTTGSTCTRSGQPRTRTCSSLARDGTRRTTTRHRSAGTAAGWRSPPPTARLPPRTPRPAAWLGARAASAADAPALRVVQAGVDARTGIRVGRDGRMYVFTDAGAPRGRLAVADPSQPEPSGWRDLIGEDPEAVLEDFA